MKLSVSIPDELWDDATNEAGITSPSRIVQRALDVFTSSSARYFEPGEGHAEALKKLAAAKRKEAEALFRRGFEAGLELASRWPMELVDWASQFDFDLHRLAEEVTEFYGGEFEDIDVADELMRLGFEGRGTISEMGTRQALRDLWHKVLQGEGSSSSVRDKEEEPMAITHQGPLSGPEIEHILRRGMPSDRWMSLAEIYRLVERSGRLLPQDWEADAPGSSGIRWQRNVRNVLQKLKSPIGGGGLFEWDGNGRYRLG